MTVNLDADYGRVEIAYLTGEGRAEGDTYLEITRQRIQNADGVDVFQRTDGIAPITLRLPGFQTFSTGIDVPFGATVGRFDSQPLTQLVFDPNRVLVEQADGTLQPAALPLPAAGASTLLGALPSNLSLPASLEARIRAFPGRNSLLQLRVSTATFYLDPTYGTYVFNQDRFRDLNNSTTGTDPTGAGTLASRLSDFVRFPLDGLAASERPILRTDYADVDDVPTSTVAAGYAYFSGDNLALSSANDGSTKIFQELGPVFDQIVLGTWQVKNENGFQGTYAVTDANPVDLNGVPTRLVSNYGLYRDYNEVLTGGGTFEMVMFPNSGEQYDETREGDIVAISRDAGGTIRHMYYGGVDLKTGEFDILPIFYLGLGPAFSGGTINGTAYPSIENARITGKVSGYTNSGGGTVSYGSAASIRRFKYTFDGAVPTGGAASGTVTVFRK